MDAINKHNKLATVLTYAILEWCLIILIFANGVFGYLTYKFAEAVGLEPPCLFCSRVDHLFEGEARRRRRSCRDFLCGKHAGEVAKLGFCSAHGRLAEAQEMCEDCSAASRPAEPDVVAWMQRSEQGEKDLRCSCCDVILESGFYYLPFKLAAGADEDSRGFVEEKKERDEGHWKLSKLDAVFPEERLDGVELAPGKASQNRGDSVVELVAEERDVDRFGDFACCVVDGGSLEDGVGEGERVIPVELIDEVTVRKSPVAIVLCREFDRELARVEREIDLGGVGSNGSCDEYNCMLEELDEVLNRVSVEEEDASLTSGVEGVDNAEKSSTPRWVVADEADVVLDFGCTVKEECELVSAEERTDVGELNCARDCEMEQVEFVHEVGRGEAETVAEDDSVAVDSLMTIDVAKEMCIDEESSVLDATEWREDVSIACELDLPQDVPVSTNGSAGVFIEELLGDETQDNERNVIIGDEEAIDEISPDTPISKEEHIVSVHLNESNSLSQDENELSLRQSVITDIDQVIETEPAASVAQSPERTDEFPDNNEIEEERLPETPTQIDGIHSLHKRFMFGRRESGTESLDGSVASDAEGIDTSNVDQLKSALRAEQKALSALYAELEEERNASAIAANQTMAMITRLQEEKACMQMEALQYQRMMEEQSEYDQELLHHLNELLTEREHEKQSLEEDLELYRRKYLRYKAYKKRMLRSKANGKSGGASSESSGDEESDGLSLELHEDGECAYDPNKGFQHSPLNFLSITPGKDRTTIENLTLPADASANLHEERNAILEKLSTLEERLLALEDENFLGALEHSSYENRHLTNGNHVAHMSDEDSSPNALSDHHNGNGMLHSKKRNRVTGGKRLLPLFDAVHVNGYDEPTRLLVTGTSPETMAKLKEQEKLAIIKKVEIMSEKLQSLEAEREFLKHCVSSLSKGDEAMDILLEIVYQLRDLKSVELRMLKNGDGPIYPQ